MVRADLDKRITETLRNYEKSVANSQERLTWLKEEEKNNFGSSYSSLVEEEISEVTGQIKEMNRVWDAYLALPVDEKRVIEALCVKGTTYKDFSKDSKWGVSRIKRLRRKGLDEIKAKMGWTAAETENA